MAKPEPAQSSFRCEATMSDGTSAKLSMNCSSAAVALKMARADWTNRGKQPVEIRVYVGTSDPNATPLVTWIA